MASVSVGVGDVIVGGDWLVLVLVFEFGGVCVCVCVCACDGWYFALVLVLVFALVLVLVLVGWCFLMLVGLVTIISKLDYQVC